MMSRTRPRLAVSIGLAVLVLGASVGLGAEFAAPAAAAACPTVGSPSDWLTTYTFSGQTGSYWLEGETFNWDANGQITGQVATQNGGDPGPNTMSGTLDCTTYAMSGTWSFGGGVVSWTATLASDGNSIFNGAWLWNHDQVSDSGEWSSARVMRSVQASGVTDLNTDTGSGATTTEPLQVAVSSPVTGNIAVSLGTAESPALGGYQLLDQVVHIMAPAGSPTSPLQFGFVLDSSTLFGASAGEIQVFRNGAMVPECAPDAGTAATPDPCVASRTSVAGGDVAIAVRTSAASIWGFGVNAGRNGLVVTTGALANAHFGQAYNETVTAAGGKLPYKWKRLGQLPRGLKFKPKTGVITGKPKARGTYTFKVIASDASKPRTVASHTFTITVT